MSDKTNPDLGAPPGAKTNPYLDNDDERDGTDEYAGTILGDDRNEPPELDDDVQPAAEVEAHALTVAEQANAISIVTDADFESAGAFIVETINPMLAEVEATFGPIVKAAHTAHKTAVAKRKEVETPLREAKAVVGRMLAEYDEAREREAKAAAEKAEREAQEAAEAAQLEVAAELEAEGRKVEAEIVLQREPVPVAPPPSSPAVTKPKAAGVQMRKTWDYEIVDAGKIKADFLVPDKAGIGKTVRALGERAADLVGGIRVFQKRGVSTKR